MEQGRSSNSSSSAQEKGGPFAFSKRPGATRKANDENAATTRYFIESSSVKVAQGVSGDVEDKGSVKAFLPYLYAGVQHSFQDIGVRNLSELQAGVRAEKVRFEL